MTFLIMIFMICIFHGKLLTPTQEGIHKNLPDDRVWATNTTRQVGWYCYEIMIRIDFHDSLTND